MRDLTSWKSGCLLVSLSVAFSVIAMTSCKTIPNRAEVKGNPCSTSAGKAAGKAGNTLIGLQYETYFTPLNTNWSGAGTTSVAGLLRGTEEAIPLLGKYNSFDTEILKQHEKWFEDMGIDWLLIDWSNMLWMKPLWEKHLGATHELEEATQTLFNTYSTLQKQGRHPPKILIMIGLQNGPPIPHSVERLNELIAWTTEHFLKKPQYKHLWLYYNGKPLLTILYNVDLSCDQVSKHTRGIIAPDWTVRYMGAQLQITRVDKCGFWSWMDGTIRQIATYQNGRAEEVVVTPSCFDTGGWLASTAVGRDHGAPYIESWKVAFEDRPKFIQIHQWNEFAGQQNGHGGGPKGNFYGDEYSPELSDDLEPTYMHKYGYRGSGGWGYYYANMTKALISLYRNETPISRSWCCRARFGPQL